MSKVFDYFCRRPIVMYILIIFIGLLPALVQANAQGASFMATHPELERCLQRASIYDRQERHDQVLMHCQKRFAGDFSLCVNLAAYIRSHEKKNGALRECVTDHRQEIQLEECLMAYDQAADALTADRGRSWCLENLKPKSFEQCMNAAMRFEAAFRKEEQLVKCLASFKAPSMNQGEERHVTEELRRRSKEIIESPGEQVRELIPSSSSQSR